MKIPSRVEFFLSEYVGFNFFKSYQPQSRYITNLQTHIHLQSLNSFAILYYGRISKLAFICSMHLTQRLLTSNLVRNLLKVIYVNVEWVRYAIKINRRLIVRELEELGLENVLVKFIPEILQSKFKKKTLI